MHAQALTSETRDKTTTLFRDPMQLDALRHIKVVVNMHVLIWIQAKVERIFYGGAVVVVEAVVG